MIKGKYLKTLLAVNFEDLNAFLRSMFRAPPFTDNYSNYKPLIDYEYLSELIAANEDELDPDNVRQFRLRYEEGGSAAAPDNASVI